jgi:hypothetical protein
LKYLCFRIAAVLCALLVTGGSVFSQTAQKTAPQPSLSLQDTDAWIVDFLDAHGCSTMELRFEGGVNPLIMRFCNKITRSKACNLTLQRSAATLSYTNGGPAPEYQDPYLIDMSDFDPTQTVLSHNWQKPVDDTRTTMITPANTVELVTKDHKLV